MSQFYTILTTIGQTKIASAIASGVPLELTDMAIGDGNGVEVTPNGTETQLYRQVYTGDITNKQEPADMPGVVIVEFVVPMTSGGYTVREVGVFDADGDLIAIGNFPATPKTLISEGSARELTVRTYLQVNETSAVTIVIDPTFTMASRQWVIDNFVEKDRMRGGLNNQVLTKKSNLDLDWEWRNIGDTPITVNSQVETQTLAASQTVVNLTFRTTQGMALFIEGYRSFDFTINNPTQFTLGTSFPAGTQIWVVQNEPEGSLTNYDRKTGGGTLLNGGRYFLDDSMTYTLQPVSALQIGSSVALAKPKGKVPKINVNGANGEKILSNLGDLTTFEYRSDAHLQFVFNGTNWEVLNDVTLADAKAAILRRATLAFDFVRNVHTVTEQFGPERKQLLEALTTTRSTTATYQGPYGVASAAINIPRIQFDPLTAEPKGLLIEEQRTNLFLHSAALDNAAWAKNPVASVGITANATTAPDGTTAADKMFEANTANVSHDAYQSFSFTAGTTYTASIFVKAAERTRGMLAFGVQTGFTSERAVQFNLAAKTAVASGTGASAGVEELRDGWFRVWVTAVADGTGLSPVYLRLHNDAGASVYAGVVGSGLFWWGAQCSTGGIPLSYIPTTTASATRTLDIAARSIPAVTEGTVFCVGSGAAGVFGTNQSLFAVSDGTTNNRVLIRRNNGTGGTQYLVISGGVNQAQSNTTTKAKGQRNQYAISWKANQFLGAEDGGIVLNDTSGAVPVNATTLNIGSSINGTESLNGMVEQLYFFPCALTAAELRTLTL